MAIKVLLVGVQSPAPRVPEAAFVHSKAPEMDERLPRGCRIVVLGAQPLTGGAERLTHLLKQRRAVILVCGDRASASRLPAWVRASLTGVVRREELEEAIRAACQELRAGTVRYPMATEDWCRTPPPPGSEAEQACLSVLGLNIPHSVTEWASRLGRSRSSLWRLCRKSLGAPPAAVLSWYLEAQLRLGRSRGHTEEELATMLGYSSQSCLAHALSCRGIRLPSRKEPRSKKRSTETSEH